MVNTYMNLINKQATAGIVIAMAVMPLMASAQTTDVQSQIQSLMSQIQALQQQLKALVASSTAAIGMGPWMMGSTTAPRLGNVLPPGQATKAACIALKRDLRIGSRGDDVKKLQEMLHDDSENEFSGTPTGFFGQATARAMAKFQQRFGIASSSNGFVGPLTRGFFERRCGEGLDKDDRGGMMGGSIAGTIATASASSITVQDKNGTSRVANITASTTIQVFAGTSTPPTAGTISDLTLGKTVRAEGPKNSDGSINAVRVQVGTLPPPMPMMDDRGKGMMPGQGNLWSGNGRGENDR